MNLQQKVLIDTLLAQGKNFKDIKKILIMNGMGKQEVDVVFAEYETAASQSADPIEATPPQQVPGATPQAQAPVSVQQTPVRTPPVDMATPVTQQQAPEMNPPVETNLPPQANADVAANTPRGFVGMPQDAPQGTQSSQPAVTAPIQVSNEQPNLDRTQTLAKNDNQSAQPDQTDQTIPVGISNATVEIPRDDAQVQGSGMKSAQAPKGRMKKVVGIIVALLILLSAGAGVFAYTQKIGPFANEAYTENNLMQGIFSKISTVTSANTEVSMRLFVEGRDADAVAFVPVGGDLELQEQMERDARRFETVLGVGDYSFGDYPGTLEEVFEGRNFVADYFESSLVDPLSGEKYHYKPTKEGQGYELVVEFETDEALTLVQEQESYDWDTEEYITNTTKIEGNKVTFTEEDESWFWFDSELPKSFLEEASDMVEFLPPELDVQSRMSFASDWGTKDPVQWKFNIGGEGDFGDLTYKVDIDAMKKDQNYFLRINNFPDLFFSSFLPEKGKWFSANAEEDGDVLNTFNIEVGGIGETYTAERENGIAIMKEFIRLSDKHRLFTFEEQPQREKVNGQNLTRYSLKVNKSSLEAFYTDLKDYMVNIETENEAVREFAREFVEDDDILKYIKTEKFDAEFDYADKNSTFTLWTDSKGYPYMIELQNRIVPSADSDNQKLSDKQVKFTLGVQLGDLNKPVEVIAPEDPASLAEHIANLFGGFQDDFYPVGDFIEIEAVEGGSLEVESYCERNPTDLDCIELGEPII